ncbi:hypothetical protein KIF59_00300 [Enterobacter cloacae subsp. cloacae]|nr:hypothetical protein [Enterobacter cloacae subsp. cloacae]
MYNDLQSAHELIDDTTCAVIVEPMQGEGGAARTESVPAGAARTMRPSQRGTDFR